MLKNEFENKFGVKSEGFMQRDVILITIEMDENDGDYNEKTSELSLEDFEMILPVLKEIESGKFNSIGDCKRDNYEVPVEVEDLWNEICPYGEYGGHDLCIIDLKFIDENGASYIIKL
jgi:hypothetical protein